VLLCFFALSYFYPELFILHFKICGPFIYKFLQVFSIILKRFLYPFTLSNIMNNGKNSVLLCASMGVECTSTVLTSPLARWCGKIK